MYISLLRNERKDSIPLWYKLAKCMVGSSLIFATSMAISAFFYIGQNKVPLFSTQYTDSVRNTSCRLDVHTIIPPSPKGLFTPPPPDSSLLRALEHVSADDYNRYCESWTPDSGFPIAPYNENGECGAWQNSFAELQAKRHKQLKEIITNKWNGKQHDNDQPTFVSYICENEEYHGGTGCGGLSDRMNGMVSVFLFALLTNRAYLAHWEHHNPMPLEDLFERDEIDWSYEPARVRKAFKRHGLDIYNVNTMNLNYNRIEEVLFPNGKDQNFSLLWNSSLIEWQSNRGFAIRIFQESSLYADRLAEMGLTKENVYGCIMDYIFRPTIGSNQFISMYKSFFQMESVLSIGIQIRTNDDSILSHSLDSHTIDTHAGFFKCANQLRESVRQPRHLRTVYFLVTDSARLRDDFLSLNDDPERAKAWDMEGVSMVVTGLPITHLEKSGALHREENVLGVNSAVIENYAFSSTDYRIITRTGFGKLATYHAGSAKNTIALKKNQKTVNCGAPDAFTTIDFLATIYSLG